ncbi:unnamed protein product [Peronospora belbahrii]|uniref:Transcriptional regulatory protein n=1 Tax=Peronospora belbahrii TaxID=622444 RepID=A0AAU9L4Z2_9STRA|nr:unnamed protein product [Peronospora belbahrii]CAH0519297.1 unnamed protein product [Peronospora belbahrii]
MTRKLIGMNCIYHQNVRYMGRGPTIQGKKNATDAKRTATNASLARELMVVSKSVGGDVHNVRLVAVVKKAKAVNMSKDTIEAAIKRGIEGKDGSDAETVLYEATGPAGSALMIETLTDNKRRTAPALRHILGKYSGALGTNGSVAWMFDYKGYLEIELPLENGGKPKVDEDLLISIALDAGADNIEMREGLAQVMCDPSGLAPVRKFFTEAGLEPAVSELVYAPKEYLDLDNEQRETFDKLIDALYQVEDVNQIHHNVNE